MTTPQPDLATALHRRALTVPTPALQTLVWGHPGRCATISEYAQQAGISTEQVLDELGPFLEDGSVDLDVVGGELFVHTAPAGRPAPHALFSAPANLWERLRDQTEPALAYTQWRLIRQMERAGWRVETDPKQVTAGLGPLPTPPHLGIYVRHTLVPLLPFPTAAALTAPDGLLTTLEHAGAAAAAVACDNGALSATVTAARSWMLSRQLLPTVSVLVVESPRFAPTILRPTDSSITPISITHAVADHRLEAPQRTPALPTDRR